MVGVGRVSGPSVPAGGARRVAGSSGFAVSTPTTGGATGPAATQATSMDSMLMLQQQVEDGTTRDRQARKHGKAMLEGLATLQRELLDGDVDPGTLERLSALTEHCPEAADPGLRATIGAVSLRVQVEIARRAL
jgi:hypothetical protein